MATPAPISASPPPNVLGVTDRVEAAIAFVGKPLWSMDSKVVQADSPYQVAVVWWGKDEADRLAREIMKNSQACLEFLRDQLGYWQNGS